MSGVQKPGERQWLPLESNPDVVTAFSHRIGASRLWKVSAPHAPHPPFGTDCRARRTWPVPRRLRHRPGAAGLCADPGSRGTGPLTPSPTTPPVALRRWRLARLTVWGCRYSSCSRSRPSPSRHLQVSCCRCCCAVPCRAMMIRRCAEAVSRSLEHGQTVSDRVWFCKQRIQVCAGRARYLVVVLVLGAPFTARGKSD
jgi:hypothetical protein